MSDFIWSIPQHRRTKIAVPTSILLLALVVYLYTRLDSPTTSWLPHRSYLASFHDRGPDPEVIYSRVFGVDSHKPAHLHLLVPATSSNEGLCKTLLSLVSLGYPAPILVNWGAPEEEDEYVQHLRKVDGVSSYLKQLPVGHESNLVLLVDGWDVWFQLPPEVLIARYYDVLLIENRRLAQRMGSIFDQTPSLYQSLVFGADKISWPEDKRRPAWWAVPESPLTRWAFGPNTDSGRWREHNRPRFLNSGTIMGPVKDIIALFDATEIRIKTADPSAPISDQFHMANMFGVQEYARSLLVNDTPPVEMDVRIATGPEGYGHDETIVLFQPDMWREQDHEFHITLDYESRLFQTVAHYWKFLAWESYDSGRTAANTQLTRAKSDRYASLGPVRRHLPEDVSCSTPPFGSIGARMPPQLDLQDPSPRHAPSSQEIPSKPVSWTDVPLGTNTITGQVFPMIHFTPPKGLLETWWVNMWFYPYGEAIIHSAHPVTNNTVLATTADGRIWRAWNHQSGTRREKGDDAAGGWDDKGAWHGWHELCPREYEEVVFGNHRMPYLPTPPEDLEPGALPEPPRLLPSIPDPP